MGEFDFILAENLHISQIKALKEHVKEEQIPKESKDILPKASEEFLGFNEASQEAEIHMDCQMVRPNFMVRINELVITSKECFIDSSFDC